MESDLSDLIEEPRETVDIELKTWIEPSDGIQKAKIARHLAALANHGGGYLIFGFNDDLSQDQNRPSSLEKYNRDVISSIVKRYLRPAFQCDVTFVRNNNDEEFPVVRVPSHGPVPIVSKASGPHDTRGRPQGIQIDTYYIRKPGPESAPIMGLGEWGPLIRRCVLHDRDNLLSDISALIQPSARAPDEGQRLANWHQASETRFLQLLPRSEVLRWPVSFKENRYQLSYLIATEESETLLVDSLSEVLATVNHDVRGTVWTGWSMFYPFTRPQIAPTVHPEGLDGTGPDVLEGNLMAEYRINVGLPDFWRVAPDGRATLIRAYNEDCMSSIGASNRSLGTWLSPETIVRETTELVTHARWLARQFEMATTVNFRCTWIGLKNREFADQDPSRYWRPGRIATANQRTTEDQSTSAALAAAWPAVVANLACPVLRLFGFTGCNPSFVENMASRFVKL